MTLTGDRYMAPASLNELWDVLDEAGSAARIVGGGTWVVPELQRARPPVTLVSLRRLSLNSVEFDGDTLTIGATATYADLLRSPLPRLHAPLLSAMADGVTGGPQILSQGTVGGSVAAARPQSDVPGALAALGTEFVTMSRAGRRTLSPEEFFLGAALTALQPGEILALMSVPVTAASTQGYVKIKGAASSWPIVTAGATVRWESPSEMGTVMVTLGGATATPWRVDLTPALGGTVGEDELVAGAIHRAAWPPAEQCWSDELAPASYRAAVAPVAARRALVQAISSRRVGV